MLLFFARHFSFILYPFHLFHAFHSLPALSTLHTPPRKEVFVNNVGRSCDYELPSIGCRYASRGFFVSFAALSTMNFTQEEKKQQTKEI
jgi:hypothetical protein